MLRQTRTVSLMWLSVSVLLVIAASGLSPEHGDAEAARPEPPRSEPPHFEEDDYYELYKVLVDTVDQVERNYVEDVDRRELIEAAIEGVLKKLDPHSNYIAPEEIEEFETTVENEFGGIGVRVSMDRGLLTVMSPLVGTPAYRAGLLAGDRIVEIDGESTDGLRMDDVVGRLKGKPLTKVKLGIVHAGEDEKIDVTIIRERIHVATVLGHHREDDDMWSYLLDDDRRFGYVRVTAFSRETAQDLRDALDVLKKGDVRGLVLDLRFNPGGLLECAIKVSDLFVSEGKIVSTEGRNSPAREWKATEADTYDGFPMVVLVNRYSASAAEIVSACLQDHGRAVVMGERTWGKGSIQNVIELENGRSALKLTTASYVRPSGKNIHRFPGAKKTDDWGVTPDDGYTLRLDNREMGQLIDDQYERDIVRPHRNKNGVADDEAERSKTPKERESFVDRQLQMAVDYLSEELTQVEKER